MRADPSSIAHLYRRLLIARRGSPALSLGAWEPLAGPATTLAYGRHHQGDRRVVAVNFGTHPAEILLDQTYAVEVSSDGLGEGEEWGGRLGSDTGVVLRPA